MKTLFLTLSFVLFGGFIIYAQPLNDDCSGAFEVNYSASESTVSLTAGDTRGATASTEPTSVCSGSFYTDDIWFRFTTPAVLPSDGIAVRVYFNADITPTDVPAIGMAIYRSCDVGETPIVCFSATVPEENKIVLEGACGLPNEEYVVRVWSTGNTTATEGTLRVGVFPFVPKDNVLWVETFGGGIAANGWTTEGTCAVADSNINAGWEYLPDGLLDRGAFIFDGAGISSPTLCDGAVGVDSDFLDNGGDGNNTGGGPCPAPGQHILISPEINSSEWNVAGLSLTWTQAIRQFQSTYIFSYRTKDGDEEWSEWKDVAINTEFLANGDFVANDIQRHFMPGAVGHDFIQIRFVYNANYYMWGIDDVKIVETEANNMRVMSNFFAIAPWALIPENQVYDFAGLADIYNAGALTQTNVRLNYKVEDLENGAVIYNETLFYGAIEADSLAENKAFPELVSVPKNVITTYQGTYTISQDSSDFDSTDNVITYEFPVGGDLFALEDTFTRSVAVAVGVYDPGAPLSYAYGNYYIPQEDAEVNAIIWGANNTIDMIDKTVNIYLLQWTDTNGDQIAQNGERKFVGYAEYTFDGSEGENAIFTTVLANFENPGQPVIMQGGIGYIAIIEYVATDAADPQFFMLASEDRDYGAQVLAMDTLFEQGIADMRVYASVLGHSPDGIIANIDYEVTELDVNDNRIFFGHDIVPLVRVLVGEVNTVDQLTLDNLVTIFPNPAVDQFQVKLAFSKPYDNVTLRLIDNIGRTVYTKEISQQITEHTEMIRVADFAAGNYRLQVETPDGQRSVPVVIVK